MHIENYLIDIYFTLQVQNYVWGKSVQVWSVSQNSSTHENKAPGGGDTPTLY